MELAFTPDASSTVAVMFAHRTQSVAAAHVSLAVGIHRVCVRECDHLPAHVLFSGAAPPGAAIPHAFGLPLHQPQLVSCVQRLQVPREEQPRFRPHPPTPNFQSKKEPMKQGEPGEVDPNALPSLQLDAMGHQPHRVSVVQASHPR